MGVEPADQRDYLATEVAKTSSRLKILCHRCFEDVKQGVTLTGRNRTGPPCSVDRPRARQPLAVCHSVCLSVCRQKYLK